MKENEVNMLDKDYFISTREIAGLLATLVLLIYGAFSSHFALTVAVLFAFMFLRFLFEKLIDAIIRAYTGSKDV